jgi:hypothetical protein
MIAPFPRLLIYFAILTVFLAMPRFAGGQDLEAMLCTGDPVPGSSGVITTVTPAGLSDEGHIYVRSNTQDGGTAGVVLLYAGGPGQGFSKVIAEGETPSGAPGPLTGFMSFEFPVANDGSVVIGCSLEIGGNQERSLVGGSPAAVAAIAFKGQPRPEVDPAATLAEVREDDFSYNGGGQIAYFGSVDIPGTGPFEDVLWYGPLGSEQPIIQEDKHYPGMPEESFVRWISDVGLTDGGDLFVEMTIDFEDTDIDDQSGIWQYESGALTPIVLEGEAVSGVTATGVWNGFNLLDVASGGYLLFRAESSDGSRAIYLSRGGAIQEVVPDGNVTIPGTSGAYITSQGFNHTVSPAGRVVFGAFLEEGTGSPPVTYDDYGVTLSWENGVLSVVAREGEDAPGFSGIYEFDRIVGEIINANGQILFDANAAEKVDDFPFRSDGIWAEVAPGDFQRVVWEGAMFTDSGGNVREVIVVDTPTATEGNGTNGKPTFFNSQGLILFTARAFGEYQLPDVTCIVVGAVDPFLLPGSISGGVRFDADGDAETSDDDDGIGGLEVNLFLSSGGTNILGEAIQTTTTAGDGSFSFLEVPAGDYVVEAVASQEMLNNDHRWTLPGGLPAGATLPASVAGGEEVTGLIFLSTESSSISGTVEEDTNDDDTPDIPIQGVTIQLRANPADTLVNSTTTDASGQFTFEDVPLGDYFLVELDPANYGSVSDSFVANDNLIEITLVQGEPSTGHQFIDRLDAYEIVPRRPEPGGNSPITPNSETAGTYNFPLRLKPSPLLLGLQPEVNRGLVADHVTPLILEFASQDELPSGALLEWRAEVIHGGALGLGPYFHMATLSGGVWVDAADGGSREVPISSGASPVGYAKIKSLRPSDLIFDAGAKELVLRVELLGPGEEVLARRDIQLRRPILGIAPDYGAAPPTQGFLDAVSRFRPADFVHVLDPNQISDRPLDGLMDDWAFTQIDLIAHGRVGLAYLSVSGRGRFGRTPFRGIIGLGVPHQGSSLAVYLQKFNERAQQINALGGGFVTGYVPQALAGIPGWEVLAASGDALALSSHPRDIFKLYPDLKYKALIHHIATLVDVTAAPGLESVGLDPATYNAVLDGDDSDGFVDVHSATAGLRLGEEPGVTLAGIAFIAHDAPANQLGGDTRMLANEDLAVYIAVILDSPSNEQFQPYTRPGPMSEERIREIEALAEAALIEEPLEIFPLFGTAEAFVEGSGSGKGVAEATAFTTYQFEITPPEDYPLVGDVFWFAEVLGPDGPTTEGLTVTPDAGNPLIVSVNVDESVVGEVLLYVSYQTTDNKMVVATPKVVVSQGPSGETISDIILEPDGINFQVGTTIRPQVTVVYGNGDQFRRALSAADVTSINSSNPNAVDVSDPLLWSTEGQGSSVITISAFGRTDSATVNVIDLFPPKTKEQWKEDNYTPAELANPAISGDGVDLDGDAIPVNFEYIIGGTDDDATPSGLPRIMRDENGLYFTVRVSTTLMDVEGVQIRHADDLVSSIELWDVYFDFEDPIDLNDPRILDFRDYGAYLEIDFAMPPDTDGQQFLSMYLVPLPPFTEPTGTTILLMGPLLANQSTYGDNVSAASAFNYGGTPNFTPNITAAFTGGTQSGTPTQDGSRGIYRTDSSGIATITLTAQAGYLLQLESFDLTVFANRFAPNSQVQLKQVKVVDGEGNVHVDRGDVTIGVNASRQGELVTLDLTADNIITDEVIITVDASDQPVGLENEIGILNVRFNQRTSNL